MLICIVIQSFGQSAISPLQDYPSPNAASLGVFGQIPVDYFTGIPNISIPIHTIRLREIELPLTLRYHLASVKPDATPGWTGLGWALEAGGSITRVINGKKDEMTGSEVSLISSYSFSENVGYYYQASNLVNNANWTNNTYLTNNYSYNAGNNLVRYYADFEPDEFIFNFSGMSGSFYYNGANQFKYKSKQPLSLKISLSITSNTDLEVFKKLPSYYPSFSRMFPLRNYISKFTIIDSQGIIYEFGGDTNAIDFTTTPISNGMSKNTNTTAVTWYLTKITTPNGETIQFNYKKEGDFFINSKVRNKMVQYYTYSNNQNAGYTLYDIGSNNDDNFAIQHLSYLESITTPKETVVFLSSPSKELMYNYDNFGNNQGTFGGTGAVNMVLREYYSNMCLNYENGNYKLKLDQISISNKTDNIKTVYFTYANTSSQRLRLKVLYTDYYKYQFGYNTTYLPEYNSKKTDHWGFYNGKYYGSQAYSTLASFRTPDVNFMKAETLEKITYPTGGVSEFEYESNDYSKVATLYSDINNLFSLKNESGTAGGLRIRKITSKPNSANSNDWIVKEYLYKNPDNTSSGILSGKPVYDFNLSSNIENNRSWVERLVYLQGPDRVTFVVSSENMMNPLGNTNGSHNTYSRIIEKLSDGSNSIYCYTNQDDQGDILPSKVLTNIQYASAFIEPFDSKEIGRGLLKNEVHKNSNGITVDSAYYQYEYNYNDYVKSIVINRLSDFDRFVCIKHYTFIPKLILQKKMRYGTEASNSVTTQTTFTYNPYNQIKQMEVSSSDNSVQKKEMKYSTDFTNAPYPDMAMRNILSLIMETSVYKNSTLIEKISSDYALQYNLFYAPLNFKYQIGNGNMETRSTYLYDMKGNIREEIKDNVNKTVYLWSYNYQYPIAEIKNASYVEVKLALGYTSDTQVESLANQPTPDVKSIDSQLRTYFKNKPVLITTYTYKPLVGIQTMTDPIEIVTKYEYDSFNRLIKVNQLDKIIESYDYHYKN
jgi:hypothetical protein